MRYDLSSKDVIIFFEDSQNIEYPTVHYDVRNETYGFTMHIRTIHDERALRDPMGCNHVPPAVWGPSWGTPEEWNWGINQDEK